MKKFNIKEKEIFKRNSISTKLLSSFILFAIIIFAILWILQVVLLQTYYSIMKKSEIVKLSNNIVKQYNTDNFIYELTNYSYINNVNTYIVDSEGNTIYDSTMLEENEFGAFPINMRMPIKISFDNITSELKNNKTKIIKYTYKIDRFKSEVFICARNIGDNVLILVSPIDPIDMTTNVLSNQLLYCTIISLVLSIVLSIIMSKRISRPIISIEKKAQNLAKGNYNIEFEKAGYLEVYNLADTLNYTASELKKTDDLRRELIANVSHDLCTPLTMIKAYSEMIKDLYIDNKEKTVESLDTIIDETDRLTNLVSDMLDLSKIESNNIKLNIENINIYELTKNIVDKFKIMEENKDLDIVINSENDVFVNCDKTKMEQVMYNLISNAINYAGDNKKIEINIVKENDKVKVSVTDNGQGISEEDLPYIWDKYYKANKKYTRTKEGSGLGLSIVKNILKMHNAKYGVESKLGDGTSFWFELD